MREIHTTFRLVILGVAIFISSCGGSGGGGSSGANQAANEESSELETPVFVDGGSFGSDIVAILDNDDLNQHEIYRFDLIGETSYRLSGDMLSGGKVAYMAISPDGKKLAYLADQDRRNKFYLYLSNADGSSNVKIHDYGSVFDDAEAIDIKWSPDSTKMLYEIRKGDNYDSYEYSNFVVNLDDLGSPVEIPYSSSWVWSADGERLHYSTRSDESITVRQLDVLNGFAEITPIVINGFDSVESSWLDRKGSTVLLRSADEAGTEALYLVDLATGTRTLVAEGAQFFKVSWKANEGYIAYWLSENTPVSGLLLFDLYIYDVENNLTMQVSHTDERETVSASDFQWFIDERSVFYMANLTTVDEIDLYKTSIDSLETVDVIDSLDLDSGIDSFRLLKGEGWMYLVMSNDEEYFYSTGDGSLIGLSDKQDALEGFSFAAWVPDLQYAIFHDSGNVLSEYGGEVAYLNMTTGDVSALTLPEGLTATGLCIVVTGGEECSGLFDYR